MNCLEILDIVQNERCTICISDSNFGYKSKAKNQLDGSKLIYPEIKSNSKNIIFHNTRKNISIQTTFKAKVPLDRAQFKNSNLCEDMNIPEEYDVDCYRCYNIILDGKLNVKNLVLENISEEMKAKLSNYLQKKEDKYILNLPEKITEDVVIDYNKVAEQIWDNNILSNKLTVLRYLLKLKDETKPSTTEDEYAKKLADIFYIKNNTYNPPYEITEKETYTEYTMSIKGYSKASLPGVISKLQDNKKLTEREQLIGNIYIELKDKPEEELRQIQKQTEEEYKAQNKELQKIKFNITEPYKEINIMVNEKPITIILSEKTVIKEV